MRYIFDILKGAVMGIANVIPGVSGGTMAVAMGIYDRLIRSITHLLKEFKKSIKTLIPILIGMGLGIVGLSVIIDWMFGVMPIQTNLLFIGLILGGVPMIAKRVKGTKVKPGHIFGFVVFFALVVGLAFIQHDTEIQKTAIDQERELAKAELPDDAEFVLNEEVAEFELTPGHIAIVFACGVITSATMVIPGVSGSMMLMLMGYYTFIIGCVSGLVKGALAGNMAAAMTCVKILIPFGIGVVIGIFGIAKIIEILLKKFEVATFWCIMGLIIGSPFAIVIVNIEKFQQVNVMSALTGILALAIGGVIAYFLGGSKHEAAEEVAANEPAIESSEEA